MAGSETRTMPLADVLRNYEDGDGIGWAAEFESLRTSPEHVDRLGRLLVDVVKHGIRRPILLGPDRRIWDGHHRLCVADALGIENVPVKEAA